MKFTNYTRVTQKEEGSIPKFSDSFKITTGNSFKLGLIKQESHFKHQPTKESNPRNP
jgi:hypothetical protein